MGLSPVFAAHPAEVAKQAIGWAKVGDFDVPLIGALTELETMLIRWARRRQQTTAIRHHWAQLNLAEAMIRDLDIPEQDASLAIATCLNWINGQMGGSYKFVRWLIAHQEDITAIVEASNDWGPDYCRLLSGAVLLGSRVDPTKDWTPELLSGRNVLADIESILNEESGGGAPETEAPTVEDAAESMVEELTEGELSGD
jgi:hypothetical protein